MFCARAWSAERDLSEATSKYSVALKYTVSLMCDRVMTDVQHEDTWLHHDLSHFHAPEFRLIQQAAASKASADFIGTSRLDTLEIMH